MSKLYLIAAVVALLNVHTLAAPFEELNEITGKAVASDGEDYRLPFTIRPWNYTLKLTPYLQESDGSKRFTFDGEVTIQINSTENTNTLILHSKNLNYTTREYWSETNLTKINLGEGTWNNVTDKLQYTLATPIQAGITYILHFVYNGTMDDDMHGFYRSSYVDANNNTKWIGSTQFQTHHARRAFPSFDEPKFKATFDVTIRRPKTFNSFGNTRILRTDNFTDYEEDVYAPTPRMSTYLLAYIVSEFKQRKNDKFGVIAREEYYDQTEYSFTVGQEILDKLSDYLGIDYYSMGNDKMDMAAIPDFSAGAMENWGLLTYRERALLYDSNSTTLSAQQSIAAVVAHEQTHMWFGDLVTCDWWSYTWLNEGFARYFQYFGTHMVETHMSLDQQFLVDQLQVVMSMDSTNSTNPMSDENTHTPSDLSRMFNSISYNKGASIIRMVKYAIGEENFRKSLQTYLAKYKYNNTVPAYLLEVWQDYWPAETKQYSEAVFNSFTTQVGYPLITVKLSSDKSSFLINQTRFLLRDQSTSDPNLLYTVPISYTTNIESNFEDTTPKLYLPAAKLNVNVDLPNSVDWLIVNVQESGYYRVNYDETTWHAIHHALTSANYSNIHQLNRAQIVDDLLNLARAHIIEYELALNVLEYLESETNYLPWTAAFNAFSYIGIRLGSDTESFASYILELTAKAYEELGFEPRSNDTSLDIYNRAKILSWSCKYGREDCIQKSKEHFAKINTTAVPVNIRSAVYCNALRYGNESDYDTLFNKFLTSTSATEQTLILSTLGCVTDSKLIEKYFWAIVGDQIRRQDKSSALSSLYTENNENVEPVYKLVTENYDALAESLGSYSTVATVISNLAARFTTESQLQNLKEFNERNKSNFGSSQSTLVAAETTAEENLAWATTRLTSFKNYLLKRKSNGATANTFAVLTLVVCAAVGRFLQ
ncbi:membrane alanyl aminopeptidase-like [Rhagoletis pomonella]|uniref:membrane alanyl aminopeptidase-like n=1 Tax=Rhagoletis pomonella TaxID=28610 RepID=UPI00177EFACE|nr:membrane alanyl aminopeptidase-like [Rhagoletis pomonella]XP_036342062.1 membrane alanyl aminopeptidase-like [Rhagoletis pomonella]XP_036342140.1 membrane alanyl aminopeptidase-like [Rhagoletis pomonella]XP_036342146.1 membrane alanyl aminopeptidase-like [Rhagoletis pomonella]